MANNVYSKLLYATNSVPTTLTNIYTPSSGTVGILRFLTFYNPAQVGITLSGFLLYLGTAQVPVAGMFGNNQPLTQFVYGLEVRIVVTNGLELAAHSFDGTSYPWAMSISGYELTLP